MDPSTPVLDEHRAALSQAFHADVAQLKPGSLLDVGCGAGLLLDALVHRGVSVQGLETSERRVADAQARGLKVELGDASDLPFEAESFDWVVIRHVLHHLADPGQAAREAWRVARVGVVLAEPSCDQAEASQLEMARLDELTNELMAAAGHIHHPYLSGEQLIELTTAGAGDFGKAVTRFYGRATSVPEAEVRTLGEVAAGSAGVAGESAARLEAFARSAALGELSYNGSVAVFVRKRPGGL